MLKPWRQEIDHEVRVLDLMFEHRRVSNIKEDSCALRVVAHTFHSGFLVVITYRYEPIILRCLIE
ncbi:hypothetical protein BMS3Bbin04_01422 [bacterium BMS3Bbin04]|nr:hypothetical protein BMS3Bbin04_01422 [bacterium BMS3Bbin04]